MLTIKQGDDFVLHLECYDYETNLLFDFTQAIYKAKFTIRKLPHLGGELVLTKTTDDPVIPRQPYIMVLQDTSIIEVFIPGEITREWMVGDNLYFDVILYEYDALGNLVWQGQIYVSDILIDKRVSDV
jgi:hypothetical protein